MSQSTNKADELARAMKRATLTELASYHNIFTMGRRMLQVGAEHGEAVLAAADAELRSRGVAVEPGALLREA